MRKITQLILYLGMFIMLIGSATACSELPKEEEKLAPPLIVPEEVSYKTKVVQRGDIEDTTQVRGKIIPGTVEYLYVEEKYNRLKAMNVSLGDTVNAGDVVLELIKEELEEDIQLTELNIDSLKYDIQVTKDLYELEKSMDEAALISLETPFAVNNHNMSVQMKELSYQNTLKQKENSLAILLIQLAKMRESVEKASLESTLTGSVVYLNKTYEEGDTIIDYDKLIGIADESDFQIEYTGTEADQFTIGSLVMITYKGIEYPATVTMNPGSVPEEDKELYTNTVFFDFVEKPEEVTRGTTVDIKLVHASSENTLIIPKSLIFKSGDDRLVYVFVDGIKEERYVITGVESGIFIEISDGLEEGEELVID